MSDSDALQKLIAGALEQTEPYAWEQQISALEDLEKEIILKLDATKEYLHRRKTDELIEKIGSSKPHLITLVDSLQQGHPILTHDQYNARSLAEYCHGLNRVLPELVEIESDGFKMVLCDARIRQVQCGSRTHPTHYEGSIELIVSLYARIPGNYDVYNNLFSCTCKSRINDLHVPLATPGDRIERTALPDEVWDRLNELLLRAARKALRSVTEQEISLRAHTTVSV